MLTLMVLSLCVGLLIDDAIVVLENVERLMWEEKMQPREAAVEAMREVSGAVIAIVLLMCVGYEGALLVLVAAHRGQGNVLLDGIDPSVIDERDPVDEWIFSTRTPDRVIAAIRRAQRA